MKGILQGKPFKHPLHPMLVHFPIGLFALSFLLDLGTLVTPDTPGLLRASFWCILAGIVTALLAAVPGFVDYSDIPKDRQGRNVATAHMVLNLLLVGVYAVSAGMRMSLADDGRIATGPLVLSFIGIAALSVSGYLGGHMIHVDGIGVGRHRRRTPVPESAIRLSGAAGAEGKETGTIFVPVVEADRLRDKESVRVEVDGHAFVVLKLEGQFYAFQEFCTHRFGPLSEGSVQGDAIECPWHRSCFDVRTGKVTKGPAKVDLKTFRTQVRDGKVQVGIPARAPEGLRGK